METKAGIYIIYNLVTDIYYIGQAVDIKKRWQRHHTALNSTKREHENSYLQNAWNKYGGENFYFGILEPVEDLSLLTKKEQFWCDEFDAYNREKGYNRRVAVDSNRGIKLGPCSEERKAKISVANKGKKLSIEHRAKMSTTHKGLQAGEKNPMFGKHHTEEAKTKQSLAKKGRYVGEKSHLFGKGQLFEFNGETHTLSGWSPIVGIPTQILSVRVLTHHWSIERALTTPTPQESPPKFSAGYKKPTQKITIYYTKNVL